MDSRLSVSTCDESSFPPSLMVSALAGVTLSQLPRKYLCCRQAGKMPLSINCSVNRILTLKPAPASSHRQQYVEQIKAPWGSTTLITRSELFITRWLILQLRGYSESCEKHFPEIIQY